MRWIVTVIVIVIDILTIKYYAYDPYSKLRKTFKGNKFPPVDNAHVFCCNKKEWEPYRKYSRNGLVLLSPPVEQYKK